MIDGSPRSRRRTWPVVVLATAIVLVGAEATARALSSRLPEPLRWHSWETQLKVQQMDRLAQRGGADVVFLGTSLMNVGLEPSVVTPKLRGRSLYNAALNRGIPKLMVPWATRTVLPRLRPSLVVIGLSSNDVNDLSPGLQGFYELAASSPGAIREWGGGNATQRLESTVTDASALFRFRTVLRKPGDALKTIRRGTTRTRESGFVDPRGSLKILRNKHIAPGREAEAASADALRRFRIGSVETGALRELVAAARRTGADVMLVVMPVHPRFPPLHPNGADDYRQAKRTIVRLANETGADLLDLDRLTDDRYFADVVHLNADGARWFSEQIATHLGGDGSLGRAAR
jgi:hypothetical protein